MSAATETRTVGEEEVSLATAEAMIQRAFTEGATVLGREVGEEHFTRLSPGDPLPREVEILKNLQGG